MAERRGFDRSGAALRAALAPAPAHPDQALLEAATRGDVDLAVRDLRAGAKLEATNDRRRTPLLLAVTGDHVAIARILLALGANPNAVDDQQDTPWLVTGVTGSVAMAENLLRHHPDLRLRNRFGGTALIPASERGHVDHVRRVVKVPGIEVNHVNNLGWTALLERVVASVTEIGGEVLEGPARGPNGPRLVARHRDGNVFEGIQLEPQADT
ncbi:ankyrin repeat domain-containing protein [Naumannella sp. ID2617S]|nr:ankyrin repeat domain-containing protein [Naumannella sp. ID2617S]